MLAAACSQGAAGPALTTQASRFSASSGNYATLYSFAQDGKSDDGDLPAADLIGVNGELYGTTQYGGTTNAQCALGCGTVFAVSPSGEERVVYRFKGGADGAAPLGGLVAVGNELYGTTSGGGSGTQCYGGCGTVFALATNGKSEHVLYNFSGGADGGAPAAGLARLDGLFYGTTQLGGKRTRLCSSGCGTVFRVTPGGSEHVLHAFAGGSDGIGPVARLIAVNGVLYGTTQYGGKTTTFCATGCGTLFAITTGGTKKILHSFSFTPSSQDGAYPAAGPTSIAGEFYGATVGGGDFGDGTVFEVDPTSGAESVLHSFDCCQSSTDGSYPFSHLENVGGTLYGTTRNGGTGNKGIIFSVTTSGDESVLYDFHGKPDGANPQAGLALVKGVLYGTTAAGGSQSEGSVFSFLP